MVPCAGARPGACQQATPCAAEPRHRAGIGYDKNLSRVGPSHATCQDWNRPLPGPAGRHLSRRSCMGREFRPSAGSSSHRRRDPGSARLTPSVDRTPGCPCGKRPGGDESEAVAHRRRASSCCSTPAGCRPRGGRSSYASNDPGNARQRSGRRNHEGGNACRNSGGRSRNGSALAQGRGGKAR